MILPNHRTKCLDLMDSNGVIHSNIAPYLVPTGLTLHIDATDITLFELETVRQGKSVRFSIPVTALSSQERTYEELLRNHYFFSMYYLNAMRDYLATEASKLMESGAINYEYGSLGYFPFQGQRVFLLGETKLPGGAVARYRDKSISFVKGYQATYLDFLKQHIMPTLPTQLALVLGLSSALASRLKDLVDTQTIIFNITGSSSTGKTTIAQFMASLWGEPKVSNRGIVRTFNATTNALTAGNEGINGVPIVLDDLSGSTIQDRTQFIYTLSQGEPKARATTTGRIQTQGQPWSGVVVITSETPALNDTETRQGLLVRVIDSKGLVWTSSPEHAETIKRFISSNYGHIGRVFVQGLEQHSDDQLLDMYQAARAKVLSGLNHKDGLSNRIANKLAIVLLTAEIAAKLLNLPIRVSDITQLLIQFDQQDALERSIGYRALEAVKLHIINNFSKYEVLYEDQRYFNNPKRHDFYALIEFIEGTLCVSIPHENFKRILRQARIFEYEAVLKYLGEHGLCAVKEKNRRVIQDSRFKMRVIRLYLNPSDFSGAIPWLGSKLDSATSDLDGDELSEANFDTEPEGRDE